MKPEARFLRQPLSFWAHVRTLSQSLGYTDRSTKQIRCPKLSDILSALTDLGLQSNHLVKTNDKPTKLGGLLVEYFDHRARVLNDTVESLLMDKDSASQLFQEQRDKLAPKCPLPMNKQKGDKRTTAYFTALINMLIEANINGLPCDYDPRQLTTITKDGLPVRTLARRVDGAFPSPINPIAVWEIKEYYNTTTFGSRVADGVFESLLDGMELEELASSEKIDVKHYLFVDDRYTWWECGRSYLCRIMDMLHMGYVDEVLFGQEIMTELPRIAKEWVTVARKQGT